MSEQSTESNEPIEHNESNFDSSEQSMVDQALAENAEEKTVEQRLAEAERNVLMAQAEMENFRKRMQRESDQLLKYANLPLVRDLLDIIDNLNRASDSAKSEAAKSDASKSETSQALLAGVAMVTQQFTTVLAKYGCKPIESTGKFGPKLGVDGSMIVAQVNGERWDIELATGLVKSQSPTTAVDWSYSPFVFHRNGLLLPGADGSISASINGRRTVGYEPKYPSSRKSWAVEARLIERETLLLFPRNIGYELQRLPEVRQFRPWANPPWIVSRGASLENMAWDTERYYLPGVNSVSAITHDDGTVLWNRELPELTNGNTWCAATTRQGVLLYPKFAVPNDTLAECWPRVQRCLWQAPTVATLIGCLCTLTDAAMHHVPGVTPLLRRHCMPGTNK